MKSKESWKRKSGYNPNRKHYLTADNRYYIYWYYDSATKQMKSKKYEVGKDISVELTIELDELDYKEDLNDRYENELKDPLFERKTDIYNANTDSDDALNPWGTIADKGNTPEEILFAEQEPENPQVAEVHRIIEEECTDSQQDLFYRHYGMYDDFEVMRQEEAGRTGREVTKQAYTNRHNKLLDKVAKALGTKRVKRCSIPKKGIKKQSYISSSIIEG